MQINKYHYKYPFLLLIIIIGCAPTQKSNQYPEQTESKNTRYLTRYKSSSIGDNPIFSLNNSTVIFSVYKTELTRQTGYGTKDMKESIKKYMFFPILSETVYQNQKKLGLYGIFLALDIALNGGAFPLTAGWFSLDILFTPIALFTGGYPGGQSTEVININMLENDWHWDYNSGETRAWTNRSVDITISGNKYNYSEKRSTDSNGEISINLLQILRDNPPNDYEDLIVKCTFKDEKDYLHAGEYKVTKNQVEQIMNKIDD